MTTPTHTQAWALSSIQKYGDFTPSTAVTREDLKNLGWVEMMTDGMGWSLALTASGHAALRAYEARKGGTK